MTVISALGKVVRFIGEEGTRKRDRENWEIIDHAHAGCAMRHVICR